VVWVHHSTQHGARGSSFHDGKLETWRLKNEARHGPIPEENATVILWRILTFSVFFPLKFHEISTKREWMVRLGWTAYPCFCNKSTWPNFPRSSGPACPKTQHHFHREGDEGTRGSDRLRQGAGQKNLNLQFLIVSTADSITITELDIWLLYFSFIKFNFRDLESTISLNVVCFFFWALGMYNRTLGQLQKTDVCRWTSLGLGNFEHLGNILGCKSLHILQGFHFRIVPVYIYVCVCFLL